jgi:hypothetical protein
MERRFVPPVALLVLPFAALTGCGSRPPPPAAPAPVVVARPVPPPPRPVPETVTVRVAVRDTDLEHESVRLRMSLLERSAQLAEAARRLDEATTDLVRAMARLRSLATRAEAASAIAEAEVTLQQLRGGAGQQLPPEARQAEASLRAASAAFNAENYGGAVYLATQAKRVATAGRGRLAGGGAAVRPGERAFAVPVKVTTTVRTNLRAAPGPAGDVVAAVPAGTALTAYAWAQDWMRVTMADGRVAWVRQGTVKSVAPGGP